MQKMLVMFSSEKKKQEKLEKEIFKFFVIFSRFEFALKSSGFLVKKPSEKPSEKPAEPNWDSFVKKYKKTFQVTDELNNSFTYLTNQCSAPSRQILVVSDEGTVNEVLSSTWKKQNIDANAPDLKKVVDSIKLVRNNLFHGGKYGDKSWNDPERTSLLIEHSIKVIWALVELNSDIEVYFVEFA
ncbi:hypothetical protein [Plesiomonas shigelloides]|uniref:hypothetical protein n=1 Tax=Plesiomonas shigelloides TaxID=703 RepID=UPI001E62F0E5|nr:hypothetical protein [Plesiomonas shigelloides]